MKKIIAIAIASLSMNAMAAGKSMVTLSGYETGSNDNGQNNRSLDFSSSTGNRDSANVSTTNLALNYAYAVTDSVQVGLNYKNFNKKTSGDVKEVGDKSNTMGLQAIYNFDHKLTDTCYAAVHYDLTKNEESQGNDKATKTNTWGFEYGHRFSLGNLWGMNVNYSPSATLAFAKTASDASGTDDVSTTNVSLNFVKFDVIF